MYITKKCQNCQSDFNVLQKEINRGNGKYCSRLCSINGREKRKIEPNYLCSTCKTPIYITKSRKNAAKNNYFFCSRICKEKAQSIFGDNPIKEIMPKHYFNGHSSYKKRAFSIKEQKCEDCGYKRYPEILEVHHKDHNKKNGDISNLLILCPNCHTIRHLIGGLVRYCPVS